MAQYRLGKMICEGGYYRRVPENAAYWLLLSAKQNNPYAEALLGRLYLTGDFLRLDRKAGVDLLYDGNTPWERSRCLYARQVLRRRQVPEKGHSESDRTFGAGGADGRHSCGVQARQDLSL